MTTAVAEPPELPAAAGACRRRERVFDVAPEEDLLYSLSADGKRKFMHPIVHKGRFWKIRRAIAYGLFVLFFALPLIPVGGHPAVFLDLATRRFHVFGATFHPTDNLLLAAFGLGIIVTVFFVGSTFGRMWCGYACPQTVYLEFLFRPIEAFLEGGPLKQRKLNAAPWSGRKLAIKAAKWSIWTVVALADVRRRSSPTSSAGGRSSTASRRTPLAWKGALATIGGPHGPHPLRLRLVPRPDVHDRLPLRPPAERHGRRRTRSSSPTTRSAATRR